MTDTEQAPGTVDTDMVHEYVQLKLRIREQQAQLERMTEDANALEQELLEQFMQNGVQNIKTDQGTAFLRGQIWASYPESEGGIGTRTYSETNAALRMAGLAGFVLERFHPQTMSAWVRELPRDELDNPILPPELEGKLNVTTKFGINVRKR